jgi:hypothetical protein
MAIASGKVQEMSRRTARTPAVYNSREPERGSEAMELLFRGGVPEFSVRLLESKGFPSGPVQLRYVRA